MRTLLSVVAVLALAAPAAAAARGASAVVVVAENGGFPAASVQTVRLRDRAPRPSGSGAWTSATSQARPRDSSR